LVSITRTVIECIFDTFQKVNLPQLLWRSKDSHFYYLQYKHRLLEPCFLVCLILYNSCPSNSIAIQQLSQLPVRDRAANLYRCLALLALSQGFVICHLCYHMGPWFIWSHLKDQSSCPTVGFKSAKQGSWGVYATALTTAPCWHFHVIS
jgi:hypothetical protein